MLELRTYLNPVALAKLDICLENAIPLQTWTSKTYCAHPLCCRCCWVLMYCQKPRNTTRALGGAGWKLTFVWYFNVLYCIIAQFAHFTNWRWRYITFDNGQTDTLIQVQFSQLQSNSKWVQSLLTTGCVYYRRLQNTMSCKYFQIGKFLPTWILGLKYWSKCDL